MNINLSSQKHNVWGVAKRLRPIIIAVCLCLGITDATAQSREISKLDIARWVGADPADIINTDNTNRKEFNLESSRPYTFLLFNVATKKFFNIGGAYGRHATLSDNGMNLWIFNNTGKDGTYNIRTRQNSHEALHGIPANLDNADSYVQYLDDDALLPGVYPDCQPTDDTRTFGWKFEQAEGFDAASNKVYKISTYNGRYLTAIPDAENDNLCDAIATTPTNSMYQVWKLITLEEYYNLLHNSPSDSSSPIDITFLLQSPGFKYNRSNLSGWLPSKGSDNIRFGVEGYYKKGTEINYDKGDNLTDQYLYENGKYFCADIKNLHDASFTQIFSTDKPGWYVIKCKGFSNTDGLAKLFAEDFIFKNIGGERIESTPLKKLEQNGPKDLLEAGKEFYNNNDIYENEVKIKVSQQEIDSYGGSFSIQFGIKLEGDKNTTPTNEWTAFDNFRLYYYADDTEKPELVLDEDNIDLSYLTETTDEYTDTNLHLNRKFTIGKWNTIILPIDLTRRQMKAAFGDDVILAKLYQLTESSVRFQTVDSNSDDEVMLQAFMPYIIKPTKAAVENEAYTTPRLMKGVNQYWKANGEGITNGEDNTTRYTSGCATAAANHYLIPGVSLNRALLAEKLDSHWVSTTVDDVTGSGFLCKGTLAKTYYVDGSKVGHFYTDGSEKRDNLAGKYFMKDGTMWKVPADKQYGLKAFRCWFELSDTTDSNLTTAAPARDVKLCIDGIEDSTTYIDDATATTSALNAQKRDGVYNLNGQLIRQGSSLDALPQGIYIVNGRMIKK